MLAVLSVFSMKITIVLTGVQSRVRKSLPKDLSNTFNFIPLHVISLLQEFSAF